MTRQKSGRLTDSELEVMQVVWQLDGATVRQVQALCAIVTVAWSIAVSFALLKAIDAAIGLRPDEASERHGLDLTLHNESGYNH